MKAGWYKEYGAAQSVLEIGEMDVPEIGSNDVLVRVHASGVNPSDVKKRAGYGEPFVEERIIPHSDGAGVIEKTGTNVDPGREGERVWLYNGQYDRALGTAAEYIVLPSSQAIPLSDNLSYAEGACLGIPAMTAHRCIFADGPVTNQTILVTGGAGAVGHYAIQFAKWAGAEVITTVSSKDKEKHARTAGADHPINYKTEDVVERINEITNGDGVDRIIDVDLGGNLSITQQVAKNNSTIVCYASAGERTPKLPVYTLLYKNINVRLILVYNMPDLAKKHACKDINEANDDARLSHAIAGQYPLERLVEAHEAVESGLFIGNIIVDIT